MPATSAPPHMYRRVLLFRHRNDLVVHTLVAPE
jgi:hypothetical protein